MKRLINNIYDLWDALREIRGVNLPKDIKRKIRRSYLRAIFLKRYDSQTSMVNIVGYRVKFRRYGTFARLFKAIFVNQIYRFVSDKANPFIIDCGSNIGMSVLYFKMIYPDSEILAFEPDREAYSCLETNVRINALKSIEMIKKAISNKEGRIDFWFDQANPGSLRGSIIRERMPKQRREVEAACLSKYIDREVDFLKIDVEGAERDVIEELSNERKLHYIKQMIIEYHHHIIKNTDVFSRILRILEDAGLGYQIESSLTRPLKSQRFQDILIYAYQKDYAA